MKFAPFIIGIILPLFGLGQHHNIDSLENLLSKEIVDSTRYEISAQLAYLYTAINTQKAKKYAIQCIELADKMNDSKGLGKSYFRLASILNTLGRTDSAVTVVNQSIIHTEEAKDTFQKLRSNILLATLNSLQGKDEQASETLLAILDIAKTKSFHRILVDAYNELGRIQMGLSNIPKSIEYLEQALNYAEIVKDDSLVAKLCINLGIANEDPIVIKSYLSKAIRIAKKVNFKRALIYAYNAYGGFAIRDKIDSVIYYEKLALGMAEEIGETALIHMLTKSVAEDYMHYNLDSSEHYFNKLLEFDVQSYSHVQDHVLRDLATVRFRKR